MDSNLSFTSNTLPQLSSHQLNARRCQRAMLYIPDIKFAITIRFVGSRVMLQLIEVFPAPSGGDWWLPYLLIEYPVQFGKYKIHFH